MNSLWSFVDMADSFANRGCQNSGFRCVKTAVLLDLNVLQLPFGCCTSVVQKRVLVNSRQWKFESAVPRGPKFMLFHVFLHVLN